MNSERLLTTLEVAERLGIGKTMANSLIQTGEIASVRIGRSRRIPETALSAYITRLITEQAKGTKP